MFISHNGGPCQGVFGRQQKKIGFSSNFATVVKRDSPSLIIIPPASTKLKGRYTGFTLSVCLPLRLWTESCPLCIFNNTHHIHIILVHLIKQLQKVCCMYNNGPNGHLFYVGGDLMMMRGMLPIIMLPNGDLRIVLHFVPF